MSGMTTELETRSDAVSVTTLPAFYSESHTVFQSGGARVKYGFMLPPGQFLLYNSSYDNEACFTRFLLMHGEHKISL